MPRKPTKRAASEAARAPKATYCVEHSSNAIYSKEFTSRRKAEAYIARMRRVYPKIVRDGGSFTISRRTEVN